jgi:F420-non-reducing hydrogenase iron-sulfur subunit
MPGDCHYLEGNATAKRRVRRIRLLLDHIGLEPERVCMFNMSSAMAGQFVQAAEEMTAKVEDLGPNPLRPSQDGDDSANVRHRDLRPDQNPFDSHGSG